MEGDPAKKDRDMTHIYRPKSEWHQLTELTVGKAYDCTINDDGIIYSSEGIYYWLTNDKGLKIEVHESHLIPIEEWRDKKLKEIGI
jgi:hypothetical protein